MGWKGRGIVVLGAAWLVAACPRQAIQTLPRAEAPAPAHRAPRVETAKSPTCINGIVTTTGDIPVARAHVKVRHGDTESDTTSDDNGRFTWCAARLSAGANTRISVRVDKQAFANRDSEIDIPAGTTTEVAFGLNPTD